MGTRLALQLLLETVLGSGNVYFQPPASINLAYPCILYERSRITSTFADNNPYNNQKQYKVTVIDRNPDSLIPDKIAVLSKTTFDRHYVSEGLNHDVFTLYF